MAQMTQAWARRGQRCRALAAGCGRGIPSAGAMAADAADGCLSLLAFRTERARPCWQSYAHVWKPGYTSRPQDVGTFLHEKRSRQRDPKFSETLFKKGLHPLEAYVRISRLTVHICCQLKANKAMILRNPPVSRPTL